MIRLAKKEWIEPIVKIVGELNKTVMCYTPFCPSTDEALKEEIHCSIEHKRLFVYQTDDGFEGVIMYFKTPAGDYDIIGPFVFDENVTIGKALLDYVIKTLDMPKINFFFKSNSVFYTKLMKHIHAEINEYEYHLQLKKECFKPLVSDLTISKANEDDRHVVKDMHEAIFNDIYLTSEMLLEGERYQHVYLLKHNRKPIGYALLIPKSKTAHLEVFGIVKSFRGKGYGGKFLSCIIDEVFKTTSLTVVTLIVDVVNENALGLYKKLGFEVIDALVSYQRK